jgi:Ser/Thr protein kinase RdoA (MazF antagonist)
VLLCVPEAHLVVLSEVQGEPLREALLRSDLVACARAGKAIGAWHRTWVARALGSLAPHTVGRELEILHGWIDRTSSDVAPVVRAVLPALSTEEWDPATVVHRDLYEEQVLVGEQIGLIDLDDAALGPPELDIGNLLAHIELLSLRRSTDLTAAGACLLDGYRQAGPPLGETLLARCRALTLLRLACIHEDASLAERARPSLEQVKDARLA